MRFTQIFVVGFVLFAVSHFRICQAQVPQTTTVVDSKLAGGFLTTHADDPTQDFNSARQSFLDLDVFEAAVNIRRGAARMRETWAEVRDNSRQLLQDSITELESLARATEERSVNSVRRLDEAFARANYALAQRHYLAALRDREQMAQARVGGELRRAAEYLQRSRQQIGLQMRDDELAVIGRARAVTLNARTRFDATSEEIADEFRLLGQSLASLGERLGVRTANIDGPIRR